MKLSLIRIYTSIICIAVALPGFAGQTTIKAKLDSATLLMGKVTGLHIEIVQDKGKSGFIPLTDGDTLTRNVEIVGWRNIDTTDIGNNRIQIDKDLILQSFDSGLYTLPPIAYISDKDTFRTNRMTLKVIPVNVDTLKNIHDYKDVENPEFKWTDFLPDFMTDYWWLWLLVLVLIAGGTYFYIRWKQGKSLMLPLIPKKKVLPPYEEASAALAELKSSNLSQSGQDKEYYTRLTDILRRYISRRFDIGAMEMTSSQLLDVIKDCDVKEDSQLLRDILETADFVKFAKMRTLVADNEAAYTKAVEFVENTKPVEVAAPENSQQIQTKDKVKSGTEMSKQKENKKEA